MMMQLALAPAKAAMQHNYLQLALHYRPQMGMRSPCLGCLLAAYMTLQTWKCTVLMKFCFALGTVLLRGACGPLQGLDMIL